jgi:hypothetical protein
LISSNIQGLLNPVNIIINLPIRLLRLSLHFLPFKNKSKLAATSIADWLFDLIFYVGDIFGLPEIFETISFIFNPLIERLSEEQFEVGIKYFDNCCDLNKVWINSNAKLFTKKYAIAYVTFNTINYSEKIDNHILVHELVHICQYQKYGSVYIYRSLKAQRSNAGYNYGGYLGLSKKIAAGKDFSSLNFEQQAQVIEDYTYSASKNNQNSLAPYGYFFKQFKNLYRK